MNRQRTKKIAGWVLSVLVAVLFLLAGTNKLTGNEMMQTEFVEWGYSASFMTVIGIVEVLGGIALVIPLTAVYAVGALGVVMLGAVYTHVVHDPILQVLRPLLFLVALVAIYRLRRRQD